MIDVRVLIKQAIAFEYDHNFVSWLMLCNSLIEKDVEHQWKVPKDIKDFLCSDINWEVEEHPEFLALTTEKVLKTTYVKLDNIPNNTSLVLKRKREVIPTFGVDLCTCIDTIPASDKLVVILIKYSDGYRLETITDSLEYEYHKCRKYKSRNYVDNYNITKEKAKDLGFNLVKVRGRCNAKLS